MKQKLSKHWRRAKLFGWATLVTGMLAANALVGPLAPAKWRWVPL